MGDKVHHVPPGYRTVAPYLSVTGADAYLDFLKQAFDATEIQCARDEAGVVMHAAVSIGDGVIELSEAKPAWPARPAAMHLFVPDVDATYARVLGLGATSLYEPTDFPYGERGAGVTDRAGNQWFIGTCMSSSYVTP